MPYYIRVLATSSIIIPAEQLQDCARPALLEVEAGTGDGWKQVVLKHEGGLEIASIEKNLVVEGELGAEELQEFLEEASPHSPDSAAAWLKSYLPGVKVIYAFQLLDGTDVDDGWAPLHRVYFRIWELAGGILLWQFTETAKGPWNVGVLESGRWVHFEMDLGNEQHRKAFRRGEVPAGVKLIET